MRMCSKNARWMNEWTNQICVLKNLALETRTTMKEMQTNKRHDITTWHKIHMRFKLKYVSNQIRILPHETYSSSWNPSVDGWSHGPRLVTQTRSVWGSLSFPCSLSFTLNSADVHSHQVDVISWCPWLPFHLCGKFQLSPNLIWTTGATSKFTFHLWSLKLA